MRREYFWALVTLIIAVSLALILLSVASGGPWGESAPPLEHSVYDRRLDRLDRNGIEAAYRGRVTLLFQNWMTDTGPESSRRALRGHRNARHIYIEAMTELDARDPEGILDRIREPPRLQSDQSRPFEFPRLPKENE